MKLIEIELLLEKYWLGETSLEEEAALRHWFQTQPIPTRLQGVQALFGFYQEEQALTMPATRRLKPRTHFLQRSWIWMGGIAAGLALVLAFYLYAPPIQQTSAPIANLDTYENPEEAYQATREALLLVSQKLNYQEKHKNELSKMRRLTQFFQTDRGLTP